MKNNVNFKMTVSKITTIKVGSVLSGQIEAGKIEVGDEIIFEIQNEKNKLEVIGISDNDKKKRVNKAEKNQDVGLLVKEKQCEKIGLQEGMIIYIPQETSEEEFFSELFGDMDQTENVTEKSVELQEKSIPQNENAIRVVIVYSDKLESISVDGTYMEDIFSIQNIPIPNWFDVKQDRNGWRGLIEEIREVIDDYDVDLNFEFNGPQESKYIFEKCISELGYGCSADGMSKDAIAKSNFAEAEKAEHRGLYQRAFDYYLKAAEHGELDKAQYKVGEYYYAFCKGEGKIDFNLTIEEGISNAISYYEMAANQGNINAQIDLYEIFYVGEYVEENDKEAFKWIKMAAQQGNAEAECSIAHAYVFGTGVEADYEEAVKWYEKAAEQGCKEAIRELGFAYRTGDLHLYPSDEKSFYYYMEAAKQGDAFSQTKIAEFYMEGEGVRKNQKEAEKWYRKAFISYMTEAMEGDIYSQERIAELYMEGKGVEKDEQEAAKWYKKVLDYYTEEALKGDGEKQIEVALFYLEGKGVKKDDRESIRWYEKAVQQNDTELKEALGEYCNSLGEHYRVERRNRQEAVKWFKKAVEWGNTSAKRGLKYYGFR
ncbi:SEL1-like repeat protein [Anaerobutyricum soehngenii]|uniref:SEL1-like repeat protein n=1 Tax=Anaerobutyricum soehngenii TaxID=105843 RepID=A0ABS3ZJA8_9FIRM|nr:SEL1-like repeat protein [Anaerobutyricum soehngenii]MBP0057280.1 SEL1-like repeat protein [Anaerobutyricum soehngenii]